MSDYTVVKADEAFDLMKDYEGFGQLLMYTPALESHQTALSWRRMPPDTGGRGSYGHRHTAQEELYLVLKGTLTFKLDDDVFEAGAGTAVRIPPEVVRSIHNDTGEDVELIMCSPRLDDQEGEVVKVDDFWPVD
jgi:mannose-6-phosphate isomerase-like protein (cupin superfamily)